MMFKVKINIVSSFRSLRREKVVGEVGGGMGNAIGEGWVLEPKVKSPLP